MSEKEFTKKVALITGGADGIGAGIVKTLYACGARVIIADLQEDKSRSLALELGDRASFAFLDVTDPKNWDELISSVEIEFGRLDILVNNAGGGGFGTLTELSYEDWRNILSLNLDSVFLGCKAASKLLSADGGGSVVNISSTSANRPWAQFTAYASAKAGMTMLTKCVAQHFLDVDMNIRCNTVHPGPIRTPNFQELTKEGGAGDGVMKDFRSKNPYTAIGEPEDIGDVVAFLVSNKARYVNGLEFIAAGGTLL